jgi:hypothetical protein
LDAFRLTGILQSVPPYRPDISIPEHAGIAPTHSLILPSWKPPPSGARPKSWAQRLVGSLPTGLALVFVTYPSFQRVRRRR